MKEDLYNEDIYQVFMDTTYYAKPSKTKHYKIFNRK